MPLWQSSWIRVPGSPRTRSPTHNYEGRSSVKESQAGPHLEGFFVQVNLLITDCRPELDGLHGDVVVGVLHSQYGQLSTKS